MRKLYFLALIIGIPIVILGASHAHTLALESEANDNLDHHSSNGTTIELPAKTDLGVNDAFKDFEFDKINGLDLQFVVPFNCDSPIFETCTNDLSVTMYVQFIDRGTTVVGHINDDGTLNFNWDDVKKFKERGSKDGNSGPKQIKFAVAGTVTYTLFDNDNVYQIDFPYTQFAIKDRNLTDKQIKICIPSTMDGTGLTKTIYKSEWPDYEDSATKGSC